MAIIATGGYGRGVLAAGSDIDFSCFHKQPAIGRGSDPLLPLGHGLKVGHATRTVAECIRQAKTDMTVRTVTRTRHLLGDRKLYVS
jgi:[protein-PII] uridylyltransferase